MSMVCDYNAKTSIQKAALAKAKLLKKKKR
jgi:hypothetical protein